MTSPVAHLTISANGQQVVQEVDRDIAALRKMVSATDVVNTSQVAAARNAIAAQQQYAQSIGATTLQLMQLDAMAQKFDASVARANAQAARIETASSKWRTGANSLALLALTAEGAGRSITGAAVAVGTLSDAIASLSSSEKLNKWAAVIGAVATIGALAYQIYEYEKREAELAANKTRDLGTELAEVNKRLEHQNFLAQRAAINVKADKEIEGLKHLKEKDEAREHQIDLINERRVKEIQLLTQVSREEANRIVFSNESALAVEHMRDNNQGYLASVREVNDRLHEQLELLKTSNYSAADQDRIAQSYRDRAKGDIDALDRQSKREGERADRERLAIVARLKATNEYEAKVSNINMKAEEEIRLARKRNLNDEDLSKVIKSINADRENSITLLNTEIALTNRKLHISALEASGNRRLQYEAELQSIQVERDLAIKAGQDKATADERAANQRVNASRKLRHAVIDDEKSMMHVFLDSRSQISRGVGNFIKNVRAVELGYEASNAFVKSLREGAEAVASAASGNFGAAALHAAAAVQFAATAAAAAQEAGGGGARGGGGGGGGGGGNVQRETTRLGSQLGANGYGNSGKIEIVFTQKDADGRVLSRIATGLQRLEDLNQPLRMTL